MKRLIINADDFGLSDEVVRGIVDGHQAGVISSTSCMTNMPAWPQAAAYLRDHPELGAGVHLVFNAGRPLLRPSQVPALVGPTGRFLIDSQIIRSVKPGTTRQLRAELRAQIDRFIADVGRRPTHLDNHSSVSYVRPSRFNVTLQLAKEYRLPVRAPFGDDLEERIADLSRMISLPPWLIRRQGRRYRRNIDRRGIPRPNAFIMDFSRPAGRSVEALLGILPRIRDDWVSELLAHPGYDGDWREAELGALLDARVRRCLEEQGIELVTFAALALRRGSSLSRH